MSDTERQNTSLNSVNRGQGQNPLRGDYKGLCRLLIEGLSFLKRVLTMAHLIFPSLLGSSFANRGLSHGAAEEVSRSCPTTANVARSTAGDAASDCSLLPAGEKHRRSHANQLAALWLACPVLKSGAM